MLCSSARPRYALPGSGANSFLVRFSLTNSNPRCAGMNRNSQLRPLCRLPMEWSSCYLHQSRAKRLKRCSGSPNESREFIFTHSADFSLSLRPDFPRGDLLIIFTGYFPARLVTNKSRLSSSISLQVAKNQRRDFRCGKRILCQEACFTGHQQRPHGWVREETSMRSFNERGIERDDIH